MLTDERHDRIRQLLIEKGRVLAADLALEFGVSEDTVRRDLRELAKSGVCRRVYGGALLPAADQGTLAIRSTVSSGGKARLAHAAADLVKEGQTVFIDAGSTNLAIAQALPRHKRLTVVTNAPAVASALSDHLRCTIIMLGGTYAHQKGACVGPQTIRDVQRIYADLFILGACGIDTAVGITALDSGEAEVKRAMIEQSNMLLVAATAEKLGTIAPFKIGEAAVIDYLVVDHDAPREVVEALALASVRVQFA